MKQVFTKTQPKTPSYGSPLGLSKCRDNTKKKSRIRETKNLWTDEDSITDTKKILRLSKISEIVQKFIMLKLDDMKNLFFKCMTILTVS